MLSHLNSATVSCAQLSEYGTWLCHILQNVFSVSPLELCLNAFQIIHLLGAGKVLSPDVIPLLKVCFDLFQEPGWDLIAGIIFCMLCSFCISLGIQED